MLGQIGAGVKQPGQLLRSIPGLTKKVLYQRLKKLERFDYIRRKLVSEKPIKVHYTLKPSGRRVMKIIQMIHQL